MWLAIVVAGGCGRWGFTDRPPGVHEGESPHACASYTWTTFPFADLDVDLSVAETSDGVTVGWIPHANGSLYGVGLAADWSMATDPAGTMIKGGGWLGGAIGYVDGNLVAAEAASDLHGVKLDTLHDDLGGDYEFGCPMARHSSKPPMLHAGPDLIAPTGFDNGVAVWPIVNWSQQPSTMTLSSDGVTAMTATTVGQRAVIVWSSNDACNVATLTDAVTATIAPTAPPCAAPRIASDGVGVALVYESSAGVYLAVGDATTLDVTRATLVADRATSPRIAYDGGHYWISYLDAGGSPVAGHLDSDGNLYSSGLPGAPAHDGYELAIVDGAPWLFAAQPDGLGATMLCTP